VKKGWIWAICILLLISSATATISEYPSMFIKDGRLTATLVKSYARDSKEITAANLILRDLEPNRLQLVTFNSPGKGDEIIVGTPCTNSRIRELLNIPLEKCAMYFQGTEGLIKVVEDGNIHLIVTGSDSNSVLDATRVLIDDRQRSALNVNTVPVRRGYYRRYQVTAGGRALDIGETIGAVTPSIYTGYPYTTYNRAPYRYPKYEYSTRYGTRYTRQRAGYYPYNSPYPTQYYNGVPTRGVNVFGGRAYFSNK